MDVTGIFQIAQNFPTRVKHYARQLMNLYKMDSIQFSAQFFQCINFLLFTPDKINIETVMEFIKNFFMLFEQNDEDLHPFQEEILLHILKDEIMFSKTQYIRFRACRLLQKILSKLSGNISLSEEICEKIITPMAILLKDTNSSIRAEAIASLYRLQDPQEPDDIVTKLYIFHLCNDPMAKVRRNCIQYLAVSFHFLPYVFERISDVDEIVRKNSFLYLSRFNFKTFTIQQRTTLLNYGLQDDSKIVRHYVREEVVPKWIEKFDNSIFQFLEMICLDVDQEKLDNSVTTSKILLKYLFSKNTIEGCIEMLGLNESRMINLEDITHEKMLCWSTFLEYFYYNKNETTILDDILPEVISLCQYINDYLVTDLHIKQNELISQSILLQLLEILHFCNFAEIAGFDATKNLITHLLTTKKLSAEIIELLMGILLKMFPDMDQRNSEVDTIIFDLINSDKEEMATEPSSRTALLKDVKIAELMFQKFNLREEEEKAVQDADYLKAAEIKTKINDLNKIIEREKNIISPVVQKKEICLTNEDIECQVLGIYAALLLTPKMDSVPLNITTFIEDVVLVTLRDIMKSIVIQKAALICLVRFALQNENYATIAVRTVLLKLAVLKQIPDLFDVSLMRVCLNSIADLVTLYGSTYFSEDENEDKNETNDKSKRILYQFETEMNEIENTINNLAIEENITAKSLISILVSYLEDDDPAIRTIAGESLCRLLIRGVLQSSRIISRLNIYMFNPETARDEKLRQIISTALSYCATLSEFQKIFEEAFFLTMKTFFEAPPSSPLIHIDSQILLSHLIYHTSPTLKPSNKYNSHNNIALKMCETMLEEPNGLAAYYYPKQIVTLSIDMDDEYLVETLSKMAKSIIDDTDSKTTKLGMNKFLNVLSKHCKSTHNKFSNERKNGPENRNVNTSKLYQKAVVVLERYEEQNNTNLISSNPTIDAYVTANNVITSSSEDEYSDFDDLQQPISKRKKQD